MDISAASLLIRQHLALIDEGIGPSDEQPTDGEVLAQAVLVAGSLFTHADLCDARLGCPNGECQVPGPASAAL